MLRHDSLKKKWAQNIELLYQVVLRWHKQERQHKKRQQQQSRPVLHTLFLNLVTFQTTLAIYIVNSDRQQN